MPDIRASAEVRDLVGSETLARLEGEPFRRYECWRCGAAADTAGPTSVIVLGYRRTPILKLAHASCAASRVIAFDADRRENLESAGFSDMLSKSALMEHATPPKFRSLLMVEPRIELSERTAGGDLANLWISGMIENSLTLMRTGGQLPGRADGWELELVGREDARLTGPHGQVMYEGGCSQPGDWVEVIRRARRVHRPCRNGEPGPAVRRPSRASA